MRRIAWRTLIPALAAGLSPLAGCMDTTTTGDQGPVAQLAVSPVLPASLSQGVFDLPIDRVTVRLIRPPASLILDTLVFFPADQSQLSIRIRVPLNTPREELSVSLELRAGKRILFAGTELVEFTGDASVAPTIPLQYVGPGTGMTSLYLTPRDSALKPGDTFTFGVLAFEGRTPLDSFYVGWSTSDPDLAKVDARGVLRAPNRTGSLMLRVVSATGIKDSTRVYFSPPASELAIAGGNGQIGTVLQPVAGKLMVRALSADQRGVPGVRIRFTSPTGGRAIDSLVTTDADGYARTTAILGPVAGPQIFDASSPNLRPVTFILEAVPGPAYAIAMTDGNGQTAPPGQLLSPFRVTVRDQTGNRVPTAEVFWSVLQGGGTLSHVYTVTDSLGNAEVVYSMGPTPGSQLVTASLSSGATVTLTATATP